MHVIQVFYHHLMEHPVEGLTEVDHGNKISSISSMALTLDCVLMLPKSNDASKECELGGGSTIGGDISGGVGAVLSV